MELIRFFTIDRIWHWFLYNMILIGIVSTYIVARLQFVPPGSGYRIGATDEQYEARH